MAGLLWFLYHWRSTGTQSSWSCTVENCICCGRMKKEENGKAILWSPYASRPQPSCESRQQGNAVPHHCLSIILFSVKTMGENPTIKHQWKASGILPNREVTSHLCHSQDLHRNITGIIFKTFPNLPHCYSPLGLLPRLIKSRPAGIERRGPCCASKASLLH